MRVNIRDWEREQIFCQKTGSIVALALLKLCQTAHPSWVSNPLKLSSKLLHVIRAKLIIMPMDDRRKYACVLPTLPPAYLGSRYISFLYIRSPAYLSIYLSIYLLHFLSKALYSSLFLRKYMHVYILINVC